MQFTPKEGNKNNTLQKMIKRRWRTAKNTFNGHLLCKPKLQFYNKYPSRTKQIKNLQKMIKRRWRTAKNTFNGHLLCKPKLQFYNKYPSRTKQIKNLHNEHAPKQQIFQPFKSAIRLHLSPFLKCLVDFIK